MKFGKARTYPKGKIHCIAEVSTRAWYTICGNSPSKRLPQHYIVTDEDVNCKVCLRIMEKNDEIQPESIPSKYSPPGLKPL